jgi:hypothetical protein
MIYEEIYETVRDIKFRDYRFELSTSGGHIFLRAMFKAKCFVSGKEEVQFTRKWLLERTMSRSEIVSTALKCVLTSEEHEAREDFQFRGERVFSPHFDVDVLRAFQFGQKPHDPQP